MNTDGRIYRNVCSYEKGMLEEVMELDRIITGEDRSEFLRSYLDGSMVYRKNNQIKGVLYSRLGIGSIIAEDFTAGRNLTNYKIRRANPHFIIPQSNQEVYNYLMELGYKSERLMPRMRYGEKIDTRFKDIYCRGTGYVG